MTHDECAAARGDTDVAAISCRQPLDASCAVVGKLCSVLNSICLGLFLIFHSDRGRRISHMDATMFKQRNMVAEAWSVLLRNGESRLFWDYVECAEDTTVKLAQLTVDHIEDMAECAAAVLPDVIRLVFKREPKEGEVDALLERAGGDGIEGCMGDHAKNEQNRHIELAKLLKKALELLKSYGCVSDCT